MPLLHLHQRQGAVRLLRLSPRQAPAGVRRGVQLAGEVYRLVGSEETIHMPQQLCVGYDSAGRGKLLYDGQNIAGIVLVFPSLYIKRYVISIS